MKNIERTKDKNIDKILFTRNFYLICIANLCTCMAIYSVMPVLPLYLIDVLHCKESVMGIGLAAFPLIALAVRPFSGMMSDMMDCKRLLLIATTCCAIFFPLTYMAATISIFICIRLLHGVSFSIMTTSQATMAVGFIPEKKLGMGIGVFSSMLSLGMILGPMLGLYVTSRFSYAAAFGLPFIFSMLGTCLQLFITSPQKIQAAKSRKPTWDMLFMPQGLYALSSLFIAAFMLGMISNYTSVLARDTGLDSYASAFFLLMGIGLLVSRLFSGYIVDKGYLVLLVCMADLVALGAALLLARTTSPVLFLGCGGLLGMSLGALLPSYQTVLVHLADKTKRGVANAMYFIGMDSGICLSLLMGGLSHSHWEWMSPIWLQPGDSLFHWGYSSDLLHPNIALFSVLNNAACWHDIPCCPATRGKRRTFFVGTVWGADILSLHGRQMLDKDMPQRGKIRYAR